MIDSDNEYTGKRRNKFQEERSKATKYSWTEKFEDFREERSYYSNFISRDESAGVRERSNSLNFEQGTKRPKYNNYQKYGYQNYEQPRPHVRPTQLSPMPFKIFTLTQDDRMMQTDAIANYNKYKLKFQIEQFENFFKTHQNEEWFRIKYHPEDSKKHKEEHVNALKRRCNVFLELFNANKLDFVNVDSDKTNDLLKILDIVVLKLEGGTEEDIATLEKEYLELKNKVQRVEPKAKSEYENSKSSDELAETDGETVNDKQENIEKMEIDECLDESEVNEEKLSDEVKMGKHKTSSICLRNLCSSITRKEIESICSKFDGFIRVWLSDPKPNRNNWVRQGWVTFTKDANVKEICCNINKFRVKDLELDAIVTEDLVNRICLVNGITADKKVVKSDIRMSAKIVLHLDKQAGLWLDNKQETETKEEKVGFLSNNPVLRNVSDYLDEEESLEEDLMPNSEKSEEINSDRDDNLIAVLDKIILYLRIVHSVDYYNHCKYPNEDKMPNRCGILHVRGPPLPTSKTEISQFLGKEVEAKLAQILPEKLNETENELINLGLKDFDTEVDKFVSENTKELGPGKWQCPLSGKKFRGPDFVRKHIFLKYCNKIEEVKINTEFFNNYLRDTKCMDLVPEQPEKQENCDPLRYNHQGFTGNYNPHPARVLGVGSTSREVIHYKDLDAPEEIEDIFF